LAKPIEFRNTFKVPTAKGATAAHLKKKAVALNGGLSKKASGAGLASGNKKGG
jgi:hypothetical protein